MTSGGFPDVPENDAIRQAESFIVSEVEQVNVETVFILAIRVGVSLNKWREVMLEGGYSETWVEQAAMTIFQKFFTPWHPPFYEEDGDEHT